MENLIVARFSWDGLSERRDYRKAAKAAKPVAVRSALAILAAMFLSAPVSGGASVGIQASSATTTVSLAIPSLYGINILEEDESADSAFQLASFRQRQADPQGLRFAILSTVGEGKVALRRVVQAGASGREGVSRGGNRRGGEGDGAASVFMPASSFGWKSLEDRVGASHLTRASRAGGSGVAIIVYELWQF